MVTTDQVQRLHSLFKKHPEGLNLMTLAAELAASPSVVKEALQQLTEQYQAPLSYNSDTRLYAYFTEALEAFELPGVSLSATELRGMVAVVNLLNDLNPGHSSDELNQLQRQIETLVVTHGLTIDDLGQRIRLLSPTKRQINNYIYQQVSDALFTRKQLNLHYVASDQSISERAVSPQTLVHYRDQWYLDAWCHKRQQLRTFMLSRINSAYQLNDAAREFSREELEQHFHSNYGIFSGGETQIAELRFMPGAAHLVAQQQWHPDAKGQWHGDEYHLNLPYNDDRELLRDLLSYAPHVIINDPEELKNAYKKRLQEALSRNR
ncbi:MAG: WYL domain-containing protein [Thalassolituus sp.]|jgi:predicted DNA-binding transcriptional regulator YafY